MRIGFNARLLRDATLRGWNRYALNLLVPLIELGVHVVLYAEEALHPSHLARLPAGGFEVSLSPAMRHILWEQTWLPRQWRQDRIDVYHTPFHFDVPIVRSCPAIMTLHDAIEQKFYAPRAGWRERYGAAGIAASVGQWRARQAADLLITVSEHAKRDINGFLGVPLHKLRVIPEAHDPSFDVEPSAAEREELRRHLGVPGPFVLYIGSFEPRKNVPFLVRAFAAAKPTMQLVLAGGEPAERDKIASLAAELGVADRVTVHGWLDERLLPAAYAESTCFVYPSLYEGFGLQVCEAMRMGCVVLAANATSLPEVLGDGGATFSLKHEAELTRLLVRVASDATLRHELAAAARRRSQDFSWRRVAEQTVAVYREARRA